ncbi:MAG: disulfide bond formation protein B [Gammaproteobacteria bacterium]
MKRFLHEKSLFLAWLIAVIGTLTSLYWSEVLFWPVCHLCWYQRLCMFPLAIILAPAAYQGYTKIAKYVIALPILGIFFSAYQYLEQTIPGFMPINTCSTGPSCAQIHLKLFGFLTLPLIGLLGFLFITLFLLLAIRHGKRR